MKTRYRLNLPWTSGAERIYCVDTTTGKRTSLGTTNDDDARQIIEAKNNSERQPVLNLQIAKAYLAGSDNGITTRTWQHAIEALTNTKQGANQHRWQRVVTMLSPSIFRICGLGLQSGRLPFVRRI